MISSFSRAHWTNGEGPQVDQVGPTKLQSMEATAAGVRAADVGAADVGAFWSTLE